MRVLQLTERYPPAVGGVEAHVMRLSQELEKIGLEVRVVTTDLLTTDPLLHLQCDNLRSRSQNISVKRLKAYPFLPMKQALNLVSPGMLSELGNTDIVHAHGYGHFPTYLIRLCRTLRIPCVVTTHSDAGRPSMKKRMFDIAVPWLTIRAANRVIAISRHEKEVLIQRGVDRSKISVIPNGVDIEEFSGSKPPTSNEEIKTILYAGRIDMQQKGLDVLIRAFAILLASSGIRLKLKLMGPDWARSTDKLRELARKLQVLDKVEFSGYQTRQRFVESMRSSDVFVLPSRFEPFGIVLLEALAAGVPIVASRVGAVPEILENGKFGLLCMPEDEGSLAETIQHVLTHYVDAVKMAKQGSETLTKYSWANIALATEKVYKLAKGQSS